MRSNHRRSKLAVVIEDDLAVSELLELLLRDEGYRVLVVPSLEDARRVVRRVRPSLITLDLCPYDARGLRVLEELTRAEGRHSVPILLISAEARSLPKSVQSKVFRTIDKPFDIDEVIAAAEDALQIDPVPA